jgi:hypothetical protein
LPQSRAHDHCPAKHQRKSSAMAAAKGLWSPTASASKISANSRVLSSVLTPGTLQGQWAARLFQNTDATGAGSPAPCGVRSGSLGFARALLDVFTCLHLPVWTEVAAAMIASAFDHVLVDECRDVNRSRVVIVCRLRRGHPGVDVDRDGPTRLASWAPAPNPALHRGSPASEVAGEPG